MQKGKRRTLTIKREIFWLSFTFLSNVALLFSGIFLKVLYSNIIDSAKNSLHSCNSQILIYTERMFHENASLVSILSRDSTVINGGDGSPSEVFSIYEPILKDNTQITYIYSGYEDGSLYIRNYDTPEGYDPTERPWYRAARETDGVAQLVYQDAATGEWLFSQSKKLVDSEGNVRGAVSIDCSNKSITEQLGTKYQYDSQRSYILDSEGMVLIHPEEKYVNDMLLNYIDEKTWDRVVEGKSNYGEYKKDGINSMAYFERIPNSNFIIATAIDAKEVTAPVISAIAYLLLLIIGISIVLGLILSRLLMFRFARPIMVLKSRIEKVALGCPDDVEDSKYYNAEINGIANNIEIIVKNIAKREDQRKAAEFLSFHDSMTGLYNRRYFVEERQRLDVRRNYPLCILCCDINGLKMVNDVFGHDVGDALIISIAQSLGQVCRDEDVLARSGGDEFIIAMPCITEEEAQEIVARLRQIFSQVNIRGIEVSASLGYGIKYNKEKALDEVIRQADKMMYSSKLTESTEMKRRTVENIIKLAEEDKSVKRLSEEEEHILEEIAEAMCPDLKPLLKQAYRLRNIGMCRVFQFEALSAAEADCRNTETGYRILSAVEAYKNVAGYVLHFTEHWDGSGSPAGLSGWDIPLLSRIIGAVDMWFASERDKGIFEGYRHWFDPEVVSVLLGIAAASERNY